MAGSTTSINRKEAKQIIDYLKANGKYFRFDSTTGKFYPTSKKPSTNKKGYTVNQIMAQQVNKIKTPKSQRITLDKILAWKKDPLTKRVKKS